MSDVPNSRQEQARSLYFESDFSQAQIAGKVGVSQKTVSLWINEGKWNLLKNRVLQTPVILIEQMISEIIEINNAIKARQPGQRFPTMQEAEIRRKIMSSINILKQQQSVGDNMEVLMNFIEFVRRQNNEHAKTIVEYATEYVQGENMMGKETMFVPYSLPVSES